MEIATRLAEGAQNAIRWTKYARNNRLRATGASFDTSLALEFLAFSGPWSGEGVCGLPCPSVARVLEAGTHSPTQQQSAR